MDISYHFEDNQNLKELSNLMKEHTLFVETYENSHFKNIIHDIDTQNKVNSMEGFLDLNFPVSKISTVKAFDNDTCVGLCIFEHLTIPEEIQSKNKFQLQGQKYTFDMMGFAGFFVKEKYRENNIGSCLVNNLQENLSPYSKDKSNHIELIAGMDRGYRLLKNNLRHFYATKSFENSAIWKNDAKDTVKYNSDFNKRKRKLSSFQP